MELNESHLDATFSQIKFYNYLILLISSILWMIFIYFGLDMLVAKIVCFILKRKFMRQRDVYTFSINRARFNFIFRQGIKIYMIDSKLCFKNNCQLEVEKILIHLTKPFESGSKFYSILVKNLKLTSFKTEIFSPFTEIIDKNVKCVEFLASMIANSSINIRNFDFVYFFNSKSLLSARAHIKNIKFLHSKFELYNDSVKNSVILKPKTMTNDKKIQYRKEFDDLEAGEKFLNEIVNSFLLGFSNIKIYLEDGKFLKSQSYLLTEIDKSKLQINLKPKTLDDHGLKSSILIEYIAKSKIHVFLYIWDPIFIQFLNHLNSLGLRGDFYARIQYVSLRLNLARDTDNLLSLFASSLNANSVELFRKNEDELELNSEIFNIDIFTLLDKILQIKLVTLSFLFKKEILRIILSNSDSCTFHVDKLGLNFSLLSYTFHQVILITNFIYFKSVRDTKFELLLAFSNFDLNLVLFDNYSVLVAAKHLFIKLKSSSKENKKISMIVFDSLQISSDLNLFSEIFSNKNDDKFLIQLEKCCIEALSDNLDSKIQLLTSPILIGSNQSSSISYLNQIKKDKIDSYDSSKNSQTDLSAKSFQSFLYTHLLDDKNKKALLSDPQENPGNLVSYENTSNKHFRIKNNLFLSVLQFRAQFFKSKNSDRKFYAKQFEFIFGDLFGTLDFENIFKMTNLIYAFHAFMAKEFFNFNQTFLNTFIGDDFVYTSLRVMTSMVNINLLGWNQVPNKGKLLFNHI
jgi:hypothetical protein